MNLLFVLEVIFDCSHINLLCLTFSFLPSLYSWVPFQNSLCQLTVGPVRIKHLRIDRLLLTLIRQACKSPSLFSGWSNLLFPQEHVSFFDFLTPSVSTWTHFLGWLDSTGRNPEREGSRILEGRRTLISLPLDRKGLINGKHLSLRKVTNLVSKYLLS